MGQGTGVYISEAFSICSGPCNQQMVDLICEYTQLKMYGTRFPSYQERLDNGDCEE
jgi:hypothetical protein